jgi:RNA polymerase subunit RPABC4/transcription elongation factor Spt4
MVPASGSFECPHCGARVRRGARVCRECGSDAGTGWAEGAVEAGIDRPTGYGEEEDFDYETFLAEEGLDGRSGPGRRLRRRLALRLLVVLLVALWLVYLALR